MNLFPLIKKPVLFSANFLFRSNFFYAIFNIFIETKKVLLSRIFSELTICRKQTRILNLKKLTNFIIKVKYI